MRGGLMLGWVQLRKEMYQQLRAHVTALLGEESSSLRAYRSQYEKDLKKKWTSVERTSLIEALQAGKLLFLADFHALQQSQKAQIRLLRSLNIKRKKILFVECIEARHQKHLDSYVVGKTSEQEFLESVRWQKSWGFPWEHYRPLFLWAKKHKIKVVALNKVTPQRTANSLGQRDHFAAQIIGKYLKTHPESQMIVIYGDLHLAEKHLPSSILRLAPSLSKNEIVIVTQNSEKIYFDVLQSNQELNIDIVQMKKASISKYFCLLSVPPWVKWQSYLMFLESQFDMALDEEGEEEGGNPGLEYSDHIEKYYKLLCSDFDVSFESGSFSVYSANDDLIFEKIQNIFHGPHLKWYQYLIQHSKSFYIPELKAAYLGKPSVNTAASLAMAVFHSRLSETSKSSNRIPQDFESLIFLEAIQYFGSKMINPKRKTDTVSDIRALFASKEEVREGRESLALALAQKMKEMMILSEGRGKKIELPFVRRRTSYYEASRILGGMMGEKLYSGFRSKMISKTTILKILKVPVKGPQFRDFYIELLELVETLPEPFHSKKEKV
jgi:uncharacterized iron-regulated protein